MKNIFTLIFLTSFSICFSQNDTIFYDKDWKVVIKEYASFYRPPVKKVGELFEVKDYYINGQIQSHGYSSSNTQDFWEGEVKYYYTNGSIQAISNYNKNQLNGYFKDFYESGELKGKFLYKDNVPYGDHEIYHKNGQLYAIKTFSNGLETGEIRQYFSNGNKEYIGQFDENGLKDGLWQAWSPDGELTTRYYLKNGIIDGEIFGTDPNLNATYSGKFSNGQLIEFTSQNVNPINGSIYRLEAISRDGIEEWKMYRDEVLIVESYIKDKFKIGTWKMYSMDGENLIRIVSYGNPENCNEDYKPFPIKRAIPFHSFENKYLTFQLHDVAIQDSNYIDGCLDGVSKEFDIEGKLLKRVIYENGNLVGETILEEREDIVYAPHPIYTKIE
ncbi:toxin-antitoxin system YwqK family antitoxin [Rasiella rasia]|uniref:Toxin-antitoxin system YwqK family antitoxin n=1 Tax=Rasiella rasia TaxID=2744027 RepID=A0A6G6GJH9_9FLAO|nr:toxin-antitoxin system YwqK family antitoxin [Rasiella rasia]QIE58709.1 toxin-antitoxin system YwqK family antitoxin [Rasiella rasia]